MQQRVEVIVLEVDLPRKRIALSMKKGTSTPARRAESSPRPTSANQSPGPRPTPAPASGGKQRRPQPAAEGWLTVAMRQAGKE